MIKKIVKKNNSNFLFRLFDNETMLFDLNQLLSGLVDGRESSPCLKPCLETKVNLIVKKIFLTNSHVPSR